MKDQLRLLRDCINNDRPAVVFQGDDFCAPEILEAAKEIGNYIQSYSLKPLKGCKFSN